LTDRRRAWLVLGAVALAALVVDLGRFHRLEHADAIVPVLVSLQRWTPFYWDQERYGMLVPLLALPFRDPLANLLVQRGLLVLAGLASVVLLARHVLARRDWAVAGGLAAASLLLFAPEEWRFEFLGDQPYGLAAALALAGLALAEPGPGGRRPPWRVLAGAALVGGGHWVNAAVGVALLPLAAARAAVDLREGEPPPAVRERLGVDALLLVAGLLAGQVLLRIQPEVPGRSRQEDLGFLPAHDWPRAWAAFLGNAWRAAGGWGWALGAVAAAGLALLALPELRRALRLEVERALALVLAALAYALFAGSLRWVEENGFHWRYLAPSAVLVHVAAVSLLGEPLSRLRRTARPAFAAAVALVPIAALAVSGLPSPAGVRADLERAAGRLTGDVLAAGCTLVAGDYWTVWPAVWHASLVARERGLDRRVWGVSHRATPTVPQWRRYPAPAPALPDEPLRICVPAGQDAIAERYLRGYDVVLDRVVARLPTVSLYAGSVRRTPAVLTPGAAGGHP
jgi:hypothetical protein